MNNRMYEHPATQANLETLRSRGVVVLEPGTGSLASKGEYGVGRLQEPEALLAAVEAIVGQGGQSAEDRGQNPAPLHGVRVLITAGGTREPIDSVRYVGNRSSGRMGFALADQAERRGAEVTVIAANVALTRNPHVMYVEVETAAELASACTREFPACDVLLMAAAVSDFRPAAPLGAKIKKTEVGELHLDLERTEDVLSGLASARRPGQLLVGFAAEHGAGALDYGRDKLARKGLDAVVVNDISEPGIGFDAGDNEVTILTAGDEIHVPRAAKADVAAAILDAVVAIQPHAAEPARAS
jgi:phosphopantothenoylcysteine decarboxylase/phosphopantothenate--cysteine ligase